jgi:hypothetical protein
MFVSGATRVNTTFPFVRQLRVDEMQVKTMGAKRDFVGHTGCDQQGILLQTARVQVYDEEYIGTEVATRILFDSGSQRSYISDKVRAMLQLKSTRSEKVIIKTFGQDNDSKVKRLDVVQVKVKNKSDSRCTTLLLINLSQKRMIWKNLRTWNWLTMKAILQTSQ